MSPIMGSMRAIRKVYVPTGPKRRQNLEKGCTTYHITRNVGTITIVKRANQ
jgi:hypothetical protein